MKLLLNSHTLSSVAVSSFTLSTAHIKSFCHAAHVDLIRQNNETTSMCKVKMYVLFMIGATVQEKQNEYRMTRVGRQFCCLHIQFNVIPNP